MIALRLLNQIRRAHTHHWLVTEESDLALSYARVLLTPTGELMGLGEIETRLEFQHYGYATELLRRLSEHYETPKIPHYGRYTLDGYHFVRDRLDDRCTDERLLEEHTFVRDWDTKTPIIW